MDISSLATADPNVLESRRASSTTRAMPPPPPPEWADDYRPQPPVNKVDTVTLEDWEDLKEVWNRCLEVIDVEEPAEVLPLLRGVIHECARFLEAHKDPSVVFLTVQSPAQAECVECV